VVGQQVLCHGLRDVEALEVGLAGDHARVPAASSSVWGGARWDDQQSRVQR
jgi:hypothetical protein